MTNEKTHLENGKVVFVETDSELLLRHAKSSLDGIERKLDLCKVPEHEKREILQMVFAYASYCSQVDEAHKIADTK